MANGGRRIPQWSLSLRKTAENGTKTVPPFEGPQHVVLVSVLSDEPVPPSRLGPKVPRDLETICLKCLAKEPARRKPTSALDGRPAAT
jgi:hypothetical protein